jgi:hypothetical protein
MCCPTGPRPPPCTSPPPLDAERTREAQAGRRCGDDRRGAMRFGRSLIALTAKGIPLQKALRLPPRRRRFDRLSAPRVDPYRSGFDPQAAQRGPAHPLKQSPRRVAYELRLHQPLRWCSCGPPRDHRASAERVRRKRRCNLSPADRPGCSGHALPRHRRSSGRLVRASPRCRTTRAPIMIAAYRCRRESGRARGSVL